MTFVVKVIVGRSMDGGEFMQGLDVPEPGHRSFSSAERLVCVFSSIIVEPLTTKLTILDPNDFHCGTVRTKSVRHDDFWLAVAPHCTLQELQRSPAIPALCDEDFKHLTFVTDGAP